MDWVIVARAVIVCQAILSSQLSSSSPAGKFIQVAKDDVGGHYYSQVIYTPTIQGLVTWGTRTHSEPIRAHETQHFLVKENRWIDALPVGKEKTWAGEYKKWPDWWICHPTGSFYEREDVEMPRPNSSFYQVCWDDHNRRLVYYVGSMTFSYDPSERQWKLIHGRTVKEQPPAMLLWSSLCYDPINRQILLFGGGGIDASDGRPHTWTFDVSNDRWSRLKLDVEPPARCNSRMVYDSKNKLIVLFGGDGQDRGLADTWVFDVTKQRWEERRPPRSPSPRHCHALTYLDKSGLVLLVGGKPVCDYRDYRKLAKETWTYDVVRNSWTPLDVETPEFHWASMESVPGTDEAILVTAHKYDHDRETYIFHYDKSIPIAKGKGVVAGTYAYKTERTAEWYADVPPNDIKAHKEFLANLPPNRWIEVKPPKSTKGRTWGTAIFDTHNGMALKWGGGHSGYQGTDMAFYDVARNRFSIDRTPVFTPDPFERWARRPAGRTFFNQPWARHMRHTCAYDPVRKLGVFTDTGGSSFYDRDTDQMIKHTWLYDCEQRRWLEPIPQPFQGGGTHSPIAIPTPKGVLVYQDKKLYRFVGEASQSGTWGWEQIPIQSTEQPPNFEHWGIVYDSSRDRLIYLAAEKSSYQDQGKPLLWFFDMKNQSWQRNPASVPGGVASREAVYIPEEDAVLAYGPAKEDGPVWTRVYLCSENRWTSLPIETPQYIVHEVALEYDPVHNVAVLLWPPKFERDIEPHLFRLDVNRLE